MGSVKKALKPITRVVDNIIPNEIKPALPYIAATFGAPYLAGSGLLSGIGNVALRKGIAGALANVGTQAALGRNINPVSAGISGLFAGAGPVLAGKGTFAESVGSLISPDKIGGMTIGQAATAASVPVTAGTAEAAYDAAREAEDAYDQYLKEQEAAGNEDTQTRVEFITRYLQNAGFDQDYIDTRLNELGYAANGGLMGTRVEFRNGGDSSNILRNFRDAYSEVIGFPTYVLRDEQEFLNDLLEDSDDLSMKEIKAQMKSEDAPIVKYLNNLSGEEKKDALNKIIDDRTKADLGRTSGLFEALESLRGRGMAMSEGGSSTVEQQKRENYFDLKRDEFMSLSEYLLSPMSDSDLRTGKAKGGIMNLKMGGMPAEMDLRKGGFVPIGAKEKADDVPARLSKNEFVMTADAVRAAGGGSVNKGAKKMYDLMNKLEARV
jgi:hypothetical protein